MAGRGGITKSNMLLLRTYREANRGRNGLNKLSGGEEAAGTESYGVSEVSGDMEGGTCWVPHPRTGIYFPKGHEWVMEDVPDGAATFTHTCWFRNDDALNNPNP